MLQECGDRELAAIACFPVVRMHASKCFCRHPKHTFLHAPFAMQAFYYTERAIHTATSLDYKASLDISASIQDALNPAIARAMPTLILLV